MKRFITDKYGQKYRISLLEDSDDLFHVELSDIYIQNDSNHRISANR